jgi:KaiC/GvpD/RAD55 family RecA-like ATPase
MYQKEVNERSPLRAFERSIHGGLGRGNLGVMIARAGVGKTACLVQIAMDDLMRGRPVLHVSLDQPVSHVRGWYDEIFRELSGAYNLVHPEIVRLEVERSRHIQSYLGKSFSVGKLYDAARFLKEHMDFHPAAMIIDGYSFTDAADDQVRSLKALAVELNCEMWLSALTRRQEPVSDESGIPTSVARFGDFVSVVVMLEFKQSRVSLQLLKDHDNPDVSRLSIELDPRTLLLVEATN